MSLLPVVATDAFDSVGRALGDAASFVGSTLSNVAATGFEGATPPSVSGFGVRQSRIKSPRAAVTKRKLIRWLVPEQPIIEMYVNPETLKVDQRKIINRVRTKGGYTVQYWGEDVITLSLNGTTASSGIEGINVLNDVYRNEQLMFDPYALALQAERDRSEEENTFNDITGLGDSLLGSVSNILRNASESGIPSVSRLKPTLASMAFTVEMYWSGEVYRGYFDSFSVTESANRLGLFDYSLTFVALQKRGFRQNFMPWHRSATNGHSDGPNQSPKTVPLSYNTLATDYRTPARNREDQPNLGSIFGDIASTSFRAAGGILGAASGAVVSAFDVF